VATCFDLLIGHHQAFLHFESIDTVHMLGCQYVYIDKIRTGIPTCDSKCKKA